MYNRIINGMAINCKAKIKTKDKIRNIYLVLLAAKE
jgi:hypothetical protein